MVAVNSLITRLRADIIAARGKQRTEEARRWFMNKIKEMSDINRNKFLRDPALKKDLVPSPGSMYCYMYDPKLKEVLPYYDKFPLILLVDIQSDGFTGLNLHYLEPMKRAALLDKLMSTATNKKYNDATKLNINYKMLSNTRKFSAFKPCFKKYLTAHIRSSVAQVHPDDWDIAMFLPTERFVKASKQTVWAESEGMY